jgi:hypothetical protein
LLPETYESVLARLDRLLRDVRQYDQMLLETSRLAIADSRRVLAEVERDHPDLWER